MPTPRFQFVTGKLAEPALRGVLAQLGPKLGVECAVQVLPITVAALMTTSWVARRLRVEEGVTRVVLPGYCRGDLAELAVPPGVEIVLGPRDLRRLPEFFGASAAPIDYGAHDIEILAEINHAPRRALADIVRQARRLAADGADVIDVGCEPGEPWPGVADCVRALRDEGLRVSIDSLNVVEIAAAARAGAELALSVNGTNRAAAGDWGIEVVAIPDDIPTLGGLEETIAVLERGRVAHRLDPILEPIGCGFAASLQRYFETRRRYPQAEMLMGVGNLTELTDVDSAGVNVLLYGYCQELGVRSVLTTQVIPWARTSVREGDLARRLARYAVVHGAPPKHVEPRLVLLRDPRVLEYTPDQLDALAGQIKDHNYRLFVAGERLHLLSAGLHLVDDDPRALFEQLLATQPNNLDASHAFYLGYELAKAVTALTLGKDYRQDEALDWGFLTRPEKTRHGPGARGGAGENGGPREPATP